MPCLERGRADVPSERPASESSAVRIPCNTEEGQAAFEGSPKTLLEAMSVGLPCIGTNVPGISNVIAHRQNGYLCETDSASIKKAVEEVLEDKEMQKKIGSEARRTIVSTFSSEKLYQQELSLLKSL